MKAEKKRGARPTTYDVAQLAGVSQSAVSRALAKDSTISEPTRLKIIAAATELGYTFRNNTSNVGALKTIGIIIGRVSGYLYPAMMEALSRELSARNGRLIFYYSNETETVARCLERARADRVQGVFVASADVDETSVTENQSSEMPIVMLNRAPRSPLLSSVSCDQITAGADVGELLIRCGHKHFVFINGATASSNNEERRSGFLSALNKHGMEPAREEYGDYTYEGGQEATRRIAARGELPDAIFCANDLMALGVMDTLRYELNRKVPEDVSVVGFNDIAVSGWPSYNLTTVRQNLQGIVTRGLQLLEELSRDGEQAAKTIREPGRLIIRQSTRQWMDRAETSADEANARDLPRVKRL